ncbi:F-box/kelch-repeat protein At3g06240-like [Papaver somniferum]|uniref:F-box/kelch-repeat protein At3g06240-like n=1 Tax=Papaver somniferum TaxID=3469 RepID=UPI000E703501|nr:F-box/kelch-repeat protein At3g06240-like [Papaver somniferum]
MHSNRHTNHHDDSGNLGFIVFTTGIFQLYYFEYTENHESPISKVRRFNIKPPCQYYAIVGSFKGLICLDDLKDRFCICNPTTKEYVTLPKPNYKINSGRDFFTAIGFGYLPSTNEYKVVVVDKVEKEPNFVEVLEYTPGSHNGWRNIEKFNQKIEYIVCGWRQGIFSNAALHWMDTTRKIIIFDLADEKFGEHLSPPPLPSGHIKLGVLGGFFVQ